MFAIFRNKPKQEISDEETLTYWLETRWQEGNMCPPPMSSVEFENFLIKYLLKDKFCTVLPLSDAQTRTQLLHDILVKYSEEYEKEYKEHLRRNRDDA